MHSNMSIVRLSFYMKYLIIFSVNNSYSKIYCNNNCRHIGLLISK